MSWLYYMILFILILLIFPFPIKFGIKYEKFCFTLFIYSFKININRLFNLFKKKKIRNIAKKEKEKVPVDLSTILSMLNYVEGIRFKPSLRFNLYCNFGLIDASKTAITYGYVNAFSPFLYRILNIPFKIKKYTYNVQPDFDETTLETTLSSIIFINIITIIYMFIVIKNKYKHLQKIQCVN